MEWQLDSVVCDSYHKGKEKIYKWPGIAGGCIDSNGKATKDCAGGTSITA
jgi:hypothetical protein